MEYSEEKVNKEREFMKQYGYKWEKEIDENYLQSAKDITTEVDKKVYYYTRVNTFHKFAENGCLWASHIKRMNDWQEFELGRSHIKKKLMGVAKKEDVSKLTKEKLKDSTDSAENSMRLDWSSPQFGEGRRFDDYWYSEVYNLSFTTKYDLLSQWKMYARESGVAIEFDFSRVSTFWQSAECGETETMDFVQENKLPRRINYDISKLDQQLENIINQIDLDPDQWVWHMIHLLEQIPFLKHSGFRQEGESRLIFRPYKKKEDSKIIHSKVFYRESGHILVPYLKIYCGVVQDSKPLSACIGWPVVSLTVGPGHDQNVVFESLIHRVEYGVTKFYPFTEEEKTEAKKNYLLGFLRRFSEHPVLHDLLKNVEQFKTTDFQSQQGIEQFFRITTNKIRNEPTIQQEYESYCSDNYLCSNGIIIRKSHIPYIFS